MADLKAADLDAVGSLGPIGQAATARTFDHVVLLNNQPKEKVAPFEAVAEEEDESEL